MVKVFRKNILDCKEDIVLRVSDIHGIIDTPISQELALKCPKLANNLKKFCEDYRHDYTQLKKDVYAYHGKQLAITNIFCIDKDGKLDCKALSETLFKVKKWCLTNNKTIAIPYAFERDEFYKDPDKFYEILQDVFSKKTSSGAEMNVTVYVSDIDSLNKDRKIQLKDRYLEMIIDLGYDYDGESSTLGLKGLIDELIEYARRGINNDDKSMVYESAKGEKQNIFFETLGESNE